ncbi:hypothetical protein NQX30_03910 [Candidatus Persebacteraceae bacterium Df01]|uniref:Uncharacterized protein n=1 Tax=Candidatus Doriopsillibacter californiensis TaxID=2970740 RepID=A0ABT7QLF6_9GAMM|nr:hypothetical protein [Candidatus Persebacteraceae bacterium Df01]
MSQIILAAHGGNGRRSGLIYCHAANFCSRVMRALAGLVGGSGKISNGIDSSSCG